MANVKANLARIWIIDGVLHIESNINLMRWVRVTWSKYANAQPGFETV